MSEVGFEPTHLSILRPERSALDLSAIRPVLDPEYNTICNSKFSEGYILQESMVNMRQYATISDRPVDSVY